VPVSRRAGMAAVPGSNAYSGEWGNKLARFQ
jgi:hypothetical protein